MRGEERAVRIRQISRRGFLGGAAALGAAGLVRVPGADAHGTDHGGRHVHDSLPPRGEFTIRRAYVMSMDPALGDVPEGDVRVRNGEITAVGRGLRARGATIDGRDTIVMPGLIDTHWHMWTTLYRSLASSSPQNAYFALNLRNGAVLEPDDAEIGVRLAAADALTNGITTVHDWSHNIRGPAYADADLRALADSGLRGRFSYGTPQGHPAEQPIDLDDLRRVRREWFASGRAELLHLGLAGRPPVGTGAAELERHRLEYRTARELGLPVSFHANSNRAQGRRAMIQQLADEGMLGPQTQVIHALFTTAAEREALATTGTSVSVSPWSELLIGFGVTTVRELFEAGALVNLSVDTLPLTGTSDMFSIIRVALGLHRGQSEDEFSLSARLMIAAATIDAARGLGIDGVTGSLAPGKRADLIMVRTDDVNIAPFTDAPNMVATAAQPSNVDTVVVDGRILKRRGRLTAIDTRRVVSEAQAALAAVLARAGSPAVARASASREAAGVGCCG
jgi:5-methylthioadenosine/S-adenosylhomocysteine deaminase